MLSLMGTSACVCTGGDREIGICTSIDRFVDGKFEEEGDGERRGT